MSNSLRWTIFCNICISLKTNRAACTHSFPYLFKHHILCQFCIFPLAQMHKHNNTKSEQCKSGQHRSYTIQEYYGKDFIMEEILHHTITIHSDILLKVLIYMRVIQKVSTIYFTKILHILSNISAVTMQAETSVLICTMS